MSARRAPRSTEVDRRSLPAYAVGEARVPYAISGMHELVERETVWEAHSHPTHELLWNQRGASTATIGQRTWTITPTIGLWIPAGVVHEGRAPASTWYRTAHFNVDQQFELSSTPVAVEMSALLTLLLERLVDSELGAVSRELTEQLVFDVLCPSPHALLVRMPESALLRPISEALSADPGDPSTLGDWADRLDVSARTLSRAFRIETGMTFGAWQSMYRAQRAAVLLGAGMSVEEAGERVGYASASAFVAAFRRVTGLTPGVFRT